MGIRLVRLLFMAVVAIALALAAVMLAASAAATHVTP
jgi:hypothetical protein